MTEPAVHFIQRSLWLRAAVLGANDGILSTASLIIGVAAASGTRDAILVAGIAGLVAGAMSMAAGEYVSVSSQSDIERADLAREQKQLRDNGHAERNELAAIYVQRGLDPDLAETVARQLMANDALAAHARDELGISETLSARPIQAAFTSAASFAVGASLPLATAIIAPPALTAAAVPVASLLCLALLGAAAAKTGGARLLPAALRVTFWGAIAMALTAGIGAILGTRV